MYNFDFTPAIILLVLIGAVFMGLIWFTIWLVRPKVYRTYKKVEPIGYEYKVSSKGTTDTVWIYKHK